MDSEGVIVDIDSHRNGIIVWGYKWNAIWDSSWTSDYSHAIFEGKEYRVPIDYHSVLSRTYGSYMQLPPEEQRIFPHGVKAYWIE